MLASANLLFELGTEELPPKLLKKLSQELLKKVCKSLDILEISYQETKFYASPRRISFIINTLNNSQKDKVINKLGPFIDKFYDENNRPSKTVLGFAKACDVMPSMISVIKDNSKRNRLSCKIIKKGIRTKDIIGDIIKDSLNKLSTPKMMRWGSFEYSFVRPVLWSVLLFGKELIDYNFYGCKTSHISYGHRFQSPKKIYICNSDKYVEKLKERFVLVTWKVRKEKILSSIKKLAQVHNVKILPNEDLVEEVTAITEYPQALLCRFDQTFLSLPQEVLMSFIEDHQKSFGLTDYKGNLINNFIAVSNINSSNPKNIVNGNNRVMSARLSDAKFFYDTDIKKPLSIYVKELDSVIFQERLGSLYNRTKRIATLAQAIAKEIGADEKLSYRAGYLSKADLMTSMVREFTHLQGIIGKYYARVHNENIAICEAIEQQYWPKNANSDLPKHKVAQSLSISEKLDTIVSVFGTSQQVPVSDSDPFALRRASVGILRILKECGLQCSIPRLIRLSIDTFQPGQLKETSLTDNVQKFFMARLKVIYKLENIDLKLFKSIENVKYVDIADFHSRIYALNDFKNDIAYIRLIEISKRVSNILLKNLNGRESLCSLTVNSNLFQKPWESILFSKVNDIKTDMPDLIKKRRYKDALFLLSSLNEPITQFFKTVMVITKNKNITTNRLVLLQEIESLFFNIADFSVL